MIYTPSPVAKAAHRLSFEGVSFRISQCAIRIVFVLILQGWQMIEKQRYSFFVLFAAMPES
jgi:hypothetical protein